MSREPYRIIIPEDVHAQLAEIYEYIASDSAQDAASLINQVFKAIESLKYFPLRRIVEGHEGVSQPLRSIPVHSFRVYFYVHEMDRTVQVVLVCRGAKQLPPRFFKQN
jgi:plasmid stabilization system protein ParE